MMKRATIFLVASLALVSLSFAGSKTPYKHAFGGNGYTSETRYTYRWLVQHFDAAMAGTNDFLKALVDTARVYGEEFDAGPYASSQEINLYDRMNPGMSYEARMADTLKNWLYVYAKRYLDSIGVSVESLVVHIADTAVNITQQGDGNRSYSLAGLPMHKKRFTYQYWNNTSSDYFYPAGYVWLANGYNRDARNAIAYAYRRHFIDDSAKVGAGPIRGHYTAYFMDNQYRDMGRLGSYYAINSTAGGRTTQMDWVEQTAIQNDSQMYYFDRSTLRIDSTIQAVLDSTCAARGLKRIRGYGNINKFNATHLSVVLPYMAGVSLENPIDYTKGPQNWRSWYEMADTLAHHPEVSVNWGLAGDILCSASPSSWLYDSTRIYMMHYAFFLTVQDTNAYVDMMRFNDSLRWRDIYEVDFGRPDGLAYEVSRTGTSDWGATPYIYVMRRNYNGGAVAVLVRTAHGTANFTGDSVAVSLGAAFREVYANGDTAATAVTTTYLKPYMGKIFVLASACASPPSVPGVSSPPSGSAVVNTSPTLCVVNSNPGSCSDPVRYQFEIATDAAFAAVIRQSAQISQGTGTTCYTTTSPLETGRRYYWHCRATNGTATSSWSSAYNFTTPNTVPTTPGTPSPINGATVTAAQPVLTVANVTDPDGTAVTYYFEVSKFSNFSTLTGQSTALAAGNGTTSWQVASALENGSAYFWRVRAYDGIGYGSWSGPWSFTVNIPVVNTPPTTPTVYSPPSGATLTYVPVSLTWYNSTDADGNTLTYLLHLYDSAGTTLLDSVGGIAQSNGPTTSYSPQFAFVNATWYRWQVRAYDGIAYSTWMTAATFLLDTLFGVNQPPNPPALVTPAAFDTMTSLQVSLVAGPAYDPESDPLTYDFAVYNDSAHTQLVDQVEGVASQGAGNNITWAIPANLSSGHQYYWSCRASDGENYSAWATYRSFWAFDFSVNADQEAPVNLKPRIGSIVKTTRPTLEITNVTGTIQENLYYFEVSEDQTFINRIYSGPVAEDPTGSTSWDVSVSLASGKTYYWRSRANSSPYSDISQFTVQADVFMAPNPVRRAKSNSQVKIYNMSPEGTLTITNVANQPVRVITGNADGIVYWNLTDNNGKRLGSDIYLCYYRDPDRQVNFKFAIIR